jgi:hypothetical protein
MSLSLGRRLAARWRRNGLGPRAGAAPAALDAFEARYGVALPADLRAHFEAVDGTGWEMESGLFRFWPLGAVKPVPEELPEGCPDRTSYPGCFLFADWGIRCWGYAVRLVPEASRAGPVFRVTGGSPPGGEVAPSFGAFVDAYLADPDGLSRRE